MPQQINLTAGINKRQKQRFTARAMLPALGAFVVLGGILVASSVWNLQRSAAGYRTTLDTQTTEITTLQAVIAQSRANARPVDPALVQQLQDSRNAVKVREAVLAEIRQGMFRPGEGHSDRLLMVAQSIPASVWVTSVKAEASRLEVAGFTLEPAVLNDWVARLALHPLMRDLKLGAVSVENTAAAPTAAPATAGRPAWSFSLVNLEPPPAIPVAAAAGSRP